MAELLRLPDSVTTWSTLIAAGHTPSEIKAALQAGRCRRWGHAIVTHGGDLDARERWHVARVHGGPAALLTAFTAAEAFGLRGWARPTIHLLVPAGTRVSGRAPSPIRAHQVVCWDRVRRHPTAPVHALPESLLTAAGSLDSQRAACGLLAAAVQQRLTTAAVLADHLHEQPRRRHRKILLAALADIDQGADALSEIDFGALCRRFHLPMPLRQQVRVEPSGRRRYLDASWRRRDGRFVVAEIDGALHMDANRWWEDQLRQNEITIGEAIVLRFPSVVMRSEPEIIAHQLRRALLLDMHIESL